MENNNINITRKQAIDRIINSLNLKSDKDIQLARYLMMFHPNPSLSNMLGFINYIKTNSKDVLGHLIYASIWNDLNDVHGQEGLYLPRTLGYNQYNDLIIK